MNLLEVMKHEATLKHGGSIDFSELTGSFLYGDAYSPTQRKRDYELLPQLRPLFEKPEHLEDGYEFIGTGKCGIVFGNKSRVLKLQSPEFDFEESGTSLPPSAIPEGLAAQVYESGTCNGIRYDICERLNTKMNVNLEDVIPYLFKAREKGVAYWDPRRENFGYNGEGELAVLDHHHFHNACNDGAAFNDSLQQAIHCPDYNPSFPLITMDDQNTYIILDPHIDSAEQRRWSRRLNSLLAQAGVSESEIEPVADGYVYRIARTEITYGTPPQTQEFADYIDRGLGSNIRIVSAAEALLINMSEILSEPTSRCGALAKNLPTDVQISRMDAKQFLTFHTQLEASAVKAGISPDAANAMSRLCDEYSKLVYTIRGK